MHSVLVVVRFSCFLNRNLLGAKDAHASDVCAQPERMENGPHTGVVGTHQYEHSVRRLYCRTQSQLYIGDRTDSRQADRAFCYQGHAHPQAGAAAIVNTTVQIINTGDIAGCRLVPSTNQACCLQLIQERAVFDGQQYLASTRPSSKNIHHGYDV